MVAVFQAFLLGQPAEFRFHHLGIDDGLSHSLVPTMAEDSLGFLWFGTQDGLNRYNGYEFKTYFQGPNSRTPSDSWINHLFIDRYHQLWIWYSGRGLERYNPVTETFHSYRADGLPGSISSTSRTLTSFVASRFMFEDSKGRLWFGTDRGLHLYRRKEDSFRVWRHDPDDPESLSSDEVVTITEDRQGYLWIGTRSGLNRMDPETGNVVRCDYEGGRDVPLNNNSTSVIYPHPDGSLWVGTTQDGLNIITHPCTDSMKVDYLISEPLDSEEQPTVYDIVRTSGGEMLVGTIFGIYRIEKGEKGYRQKMVPETRGISMPHLLEDSKGHVWAGSSSYMEQNLMRIAPGLEEVVTFRNDPEDPFSYGGKQIQFIRETRNGLIWIGSSKEGVYMVDLNARQFRSIDNHRERGLYITDSEVYSIYEDRQRYLYIGTKTELNRIDLRDGSLRAYNNQRNLKRDLTYEYSANLPAALIGTMEPHYDRRIWMGAFDYKVSLYDPGQDLFLNFHLNEAEPAAFQLWSLRSICVTSGRQVYFGAAGEGLTRLREDGLSFERFSVVPTGDPTGTNDTHIQYIHEDTDGILWIGTLYNGLNRYDPRTGVFRHYINDPADPQSISNNRVKCILEPEIYGEDILWIATNNGGLNRFDKISETFTAYTMKDGLPSHTIHGILEDKVGNLWLSTNRGLVEFNPVTERIIVYTREDGLVGNEFNEGAFFKNEAGVMYFGGTKGITYFDPDQIQEKPSYEAPVVITGFSLSGSAVLPGDTVHGDVVLNRSISLTNHITLTHQDRFIGFEFASLDYAAPSKIRYRYMLDGLEEDWNEVDASQRFISYNDLPSGTYTLLVAGTNSDGNWSNLPTELTLEMLPPFWNTLWFRLVVAMAILLIFLAILNIRTRILEAQKRTLASQVEERTHDLKEVNRLLESKQEEIVKQSAKIAQQRDNLKEQNIRLEKQNAKIQQMARKLHESDEQKLKFFTNISHEFRTPLTLIMGPTEKLLNMESYEDHRTLRQELEIMYRNQRRLFKLINQLLEIRQVETGNLRLAVAEDELVAYLYSIYQLFIPYAEKKEVDFRFRADPKTIVTHFDADKLEKIFYNLLSNAFKYAPTGGQVEFSISLQTGEGQEWVRAVVRDNGPGIPEKHLPHIFDRFYQITGKHQSGRISSGIGLSLSRDLVESHHGKIEAMNDPGGGTRFEVLIPLHADIYEEEEILVEPERELTMEYIRSMLESYEYTVGAHSDKPLVGEVFPRVLVVEDNLDMQKFLYNELSGSYDVVLALNGREGLEQVKEQLPDLILSDVMMPEMDGMEFCRIIKQDELTSHIPVILLTAKSNPESQMSGLETGANDYITKPFQPEALKLKIRNILESRKQLADRFMRASSYIPENIKINQIDQGFLEKFVKLVEQNIDDTELSGDSIASELGMSKGNLYKKLKSLTGMTVNIYIRTIRLKVAARLLKQGKYNISEIAYAVGFNNPKYFSTCFSEMYSVSPKEYMK